MRYRDLRWWVIRLAILFVPVVSHADNDDIQQYVRDHYRDKKFVVRNFRSGDILRFDSTGALKEGGGPGDWTVFGFVLITDIRVTHERLEINAKRLFIEANDQKQFEFVAETRKMLKNPHFVRIQVELPANATTVSADDAMAKIFLSVQDSFPDLVPEFWKPCVRSAYNASDDPKQRLCHFSSTILSIPGLDHSSDIQTDGKPVTSEPLFIVGKDVSPPKQTYGPEPEFTDAAREADVQGTVTLMFVLDSSGTARNISVVSPRGCGLDAQAVQALRTWRFKPALKAGNPVAVQLAVEISFKTF